MPNPPLLRPRPPSCRAPARGADRSSRSRPLVLAVIRHLCQVAKDRPHERILEHSIRQTPLSRHKVPVHRVHEEVVPAATSVVVGAIFHQVPEQRSKPVLHVLSIQLLRVRRIQIEDVCDQRVGNDEEVRLVGVVGEGCTWKQIPQPDLELKVTTCIFAIVQPQRVVQLAR